MDIVTGRHEICLKICDSLGLKNVRALDIHMAAGEIVTINAEHCASRAQMNEFGYLIKEYNLKAVEDNPLRNIVRGMINDVRMGIA